MYRVYDKGNGINYIGYDENNNDKAYDLAMRQGALYPIVMDRNFKLVMDLSNKMVEGREFYFGKD